MKEKELERLTKLKEIEKDLYHKGLKNIFVELMKQEEDL